MEKKGIDVSHWQGDIDWNVVKGSGVEFAIIKAGGSDSGFYTDSKFRANYKAAKAAGIDLGAYYFVGKYCKSYEDGVADAMRFIAIISGMQFEYPVYIDFEAPDSSDKEGNTEACIGFCKTMEDNGYFSGIYASEISGFHDRLNDSELQSYSHWVARYGNRPSTIPEKVFGIWQYSSKGSVAGIAGNVDMDISYVDFPSIIKKAGLNGFTKQHTENKPSAPAELTLEERVTKLEEKINIILDRLG